jgi:hypothetical protein
VTITWSSVAGRPAKNRPSAAGLVASKAAVLRAPSSAAALQAVGVAAGQDDLGALGAGLAGGLQPDAGAAADHDEGLPGQFWFALAGRWGGCAGHDSPGG